ncbi:MAG TPA: helix-turn-helix transcriptional regulator [Reyranella sp.]|jgi:transcriptional regulator with XRE-family HTH domain
MANTISPERLRVVRKHRGQNQTRLAGKAKVARRHIQRIENSKKAQIAVRETTLHKLEEALSVEPGVLTGEKPLPEGFSGAAASKLGPPRRTGRFLSEAYAVRLIKLDGRYAIVEFSKSNPVGNIVARDIPNEAAGLRLTSSHSSLVKVMQEARKLAEAAESGSDPDLHPDDVGFWLETLIAEIEEEFDMAEVRGPSNVTAEAGPPKPATEAALDESKVDL